MVASRDAAEGGDSLVTGDPVNTAARLQQAADSGSIMVAERTARSADGFDFGAPISLDLKGKSAPSPSPAVAEAGSHFRPARADRRS